MGTDERFGEGDLNIFREGEVVAGAYEIVALLGEGGMGQVFEAFDRNLRRRVAIKANWPETTEDVRMEAQALAAVRHPGVVVVHALGTHDGIDFLVMEHVAGVTLEKHLLNLEAAGLPLLERLDILLAVAEALAAIHRAGLAHGDVKPSNVIMAPSGRVVLVDLGLVRPLYQADDGRVTGTPAYIAPEIVSAKLTRAGWPLVDAYAFGVLAYRVLGGELPFEGRSDLELVLSHAEVAPKPLVVKGSERAPSRLVELVEALLAKDPVDRPQPMDAVVWQLRAARDEIVRKSRLPVVVSQTGSLVPSAPGARSLDVLVIDDDDAIGKLVAMYVKQAAPTARTRVVQDADGALRALRDARADLVFLDLMMPRMTGFELFTYLRGVDLVEASRVVAMSAGGTEEDIQLILELGAQGFVAKDAQLRDRVVGVVRALTA